MERDTPCANCLWRRERHWPSHETEVKEIDGGNSKSLNVQTVAFDVLHSKLVNSTVRIPKRGIWRLALLIGEFNSRNSKSWNSTVCFAEIPNYRICRSVNSLVLITNRSLMYDPVQDKVFDAEADTLKCRVGRWALQIIDYEVLYAKSLNLTVCKPNQQIWTACTPNLRNWLPAFPIGEFEGLQSHSLNLKICPISKSDCQNLKFVQTFQGSG